MNPVARLRGRFARKPAPIALAAPSAERELVEACGQADRALEMLSAALKRRRAAMVRVTAQTSLDGHAVLTRMFSPSVVWAAFAAHGAGDACGLPFVASGHRRSFVQSAEAALSASRAYRRPEPAPPADSAKKESHHAV